MKYKLKLASLINEFDGSDHLIEQELRDLVCSISDLYEGGDVVMEELLHSASIKLRVFGYNAMNNFSVDNTLRESLSQNLYKSQNGTQLDYDQKRIIDKFDSLKNKRIFLSAPTSFGKTRLLREILSSYKYKSVVLIFPTNALLDENYKELVKWNNSEKHEYYIHNNINLNYNKESMNIFVLTPERYLQLLNEFPDLHIDFFFMDEIYKIDNSFKTEDGTEEDERDKVFRVVLYKLSQTVESFYLAGPYINTDNLGLGMIKFLKEKDVYTFYVRDELVIKRRFDYFSEDVVVNGKKVKYVVDRKNRLQKLVDAIIGTSQENILIYCKNKREINSIALKLPNYSSIESQDKSLFINHLENRYSVAIDNERISWGIIKSLEKGISIHHGSLPKYIQVEMLRLFNTGSTRIILSTTSITEGVNLNAKNLIFYGILKGNKELKSFDVKNIVGRAGRYYFHFVGNIYILDEEIKRKMENEAEQLDFLTYTNNKLTAVDLDNTNIRDLSNSNKKEKKERDFAIKDSGLPESILLQNRTIDWIKQVKLYSYLNGKSYDEIHFLSELFQSLSTFNDPNNQSLKRIMEDLYKVGLIEKHEKLIFPAVAYTFINKGFRGLLVYEIKRSRNQSTKSELSQSQYETCYRRAFDSLSSTIEYRIPKLLSVYTSILVFICQTRNIEISKEAVKRIINYYETGVKSTVGNELRNKGLPIITIRILEKEFSEHMYDSFDKFKLFYHDMKGTKFDNHLDDFEMKLLKELI